MFCSFEGGDGVGKSTQIELLADWLRGRGVEVVTTREPGGTELGLELRAAVLHGGHVSARTEALLYATDRAHHVASVVRPALERGAVVLTDRYLDSSVAYQGDGRALGAVEVEALSLWATEGLDSAPDGAARPGPRGGPAPGWPTARRPRTGWRAPGWTSTAARGRRSSTEPRRTRRAGSWWTPRSRST